MTHQPLIFRRQESASSQFRCTCGHLSNHCVRVHAASTLGLILELEMLRQWIQTWWNYSKHICPEIFLCSSQSALWNTKMYLCCVTGIDFILCILFVLSVFITTVFFVIHTENKQSGVVIVKVIGRWIDNEKDCRVEVLEDWQEDRGNCLQPVIIVSQLVHNYLFWCDGHCRDWDSDCHTATAGYIWQQRPVQLKSVLFSLVFKAWNTSCQIYILMRLFWTCRQARRAKARRGKLFKQIPKDDGAHRCGFLKCDLGSEALIKWEVHSSLCRHSPSCSLPSVSAWWRPTIPHPYSLPRPPGAPSLPPSLPASCCQNNPFPCPAAPLCSLWSVQLWWCTLYLKAASAMGN